MSFRSTLALAALTSVTAFGCGPGGEKPDVQHTEQVGALPDTFTPPPQIPGGAGSSPAAPGMPAPPATAAAPQPPAAPAKPVIVDVRTQQEYDAGHVQGAILIPHDQMEQRWQELEPYRNQPLVLYCRSGRRSSLAIEVLKSKGFTQLDNGGGIDAMAAKGYPVTK